MSGKEKAHKHKQISPVTAPAGGGSPDRGGGGLPTGGQGSKVYVLCAEPKEHKCFRPGTRPGGIGFPAGRIGDRGDREIVYVPNVYVPFPAPRMGSKLKTAHSYQDAGERTSRLGCCPWQPPACHSA